MGAKAVVSAVTGSEAHRTAFCRACKRANGARVGLRARRSVAHVLMRTVMPTPEPGGSAQSLYAAMPHLPGEQPIQPDRIVCELRQSLFGH